MELELHENNGPTVYGPDNFEKAYAFCEIICKTFSVPDNYRNKPDETLAAICYGSEIGFKPMQSLNCIAVVNGKPSIFGHAGMALVQRHPDFEDFEEAFETAEQDLIAVYKIKRKGQKWKEFRFAWSEAQRAKLTGSQTYQKYPRDMLMHRARWRAIKAVFPDSLTGFIGFTETAFEDEKIETEETTIETPVIEDSGKASVLKQKIKMPTPSAIFDTLSEEEEAAIEEAEASVEPEKKPTIGAPGGLDIF